MKKFLSLITAAALSVSVASAEIDLSTLSFAELAALRDQCQLEMMQRDEWQEVTVPQGLWEVGVHIPAGTWTIRCADIGRNNFILNECDVSWGAGKPDNNNSWDYKTRKGDVILYNPNNEYYDGGTTELFITLEAGDFVYIDPFYNSVVFTPYQGGTTFTFK